MKTVPFLLSVAVAATIGAIAATFSIVPTKAGDEYMILRATQAQECKDGGGCAVFSTNELRRLIQQYLADTKSKRNNEGA